MRPYDERLDHLLARAANVFAERGYHSTTMRDLAAASGMSLAGMYYYVKGKEELLSLIEERCFTRVLDGARRAIAAVPGGGDPLERLQAFIRHHVTFFAAHMPEMKVLSHEANSLTGERLRRVNAIKRRYVDLLEGLLKDAAPDDSAVERALLGARFHDTAHVLVRRGHGEKFSGAGENTAHLNRTPPRHNYFFSLHANNPLNRLEHTPKLTIAALNGHTVGGGLEIAMACDLRLAKESQNKIGLPEVNLGVLPGTGGTQRLARIVGKPRAIEMMVKGETFSFDRAKEIGLVHEVFPAEGFWEQVVLYAKQFCPPNKASKAVGLIKRAVQSGAEVPFESGLTLERELQQQLFQSDDAKEGIAAYVEKRVAEFQGR